MSKPDWKSNRALINIAAAGLGETTTRVAQFVSVAIVSRSLGPAGLAVVGTAWAFFNMALPYVQYSPEIIGIRAIGRSPVHLSVIGEIQGLKLFAAASAILVLSGVGVVFYSGNPQLRSQILLASTVFIGIGLSPGWVFRAVRHFEVDAGLRIVQSVAMAALLFLVLQRFPNAKIVPLVELISFLTAGMLGMMVLRGWLSQCARSPRPPIVAASRWRIAMRRHSTPVATLSLTGIASTLTWWFSVPLSSFFISPEQTGFLTAAIRLTLGINGVLLAAISFFFPAIAHYSRHGSGEGREFVTTLAFYTLIVTLFAYGSLALFASPLCLLLFGPAFSGVSITVQVLALGLIPSCQMAVYTYVLLAAGQERLVLMLVTGGAGLAVLLVLIAFRVWTAPYAAGALGIAVLLQAIAAKSYCNRAALIGDIRHPLRRLKPAAIVQFLQVGLGNRDEHPFVRASQRR